MKKKKNEMIKMPKTKKQKLNLKHKKLIIVILILIVVFISLIYLTKNNPEIKEKLNNTTPEIKQEEKISLEVYDESSNARPYAIMIPNDSVAKKRHYGLQKAYMIYEITVEGGITRLIALFKDVDVDKIGPVRSSRHYFLDYALESDAIYVHFGWSPQAESDIKTLGINNLNGLYNPSNMFWRDKNYSSPNNAYTSTANIKIAAEAKNYRMNSDNYKLLNYKKDVDLTSYENNISANKIKIDYAGNTYVKYLYNEEKQYYLRYNNENEDIDLLTNEQMHFKNIIILKMDTVTISGDEKGRQNLNNIGSGKGYYITNGKAIEITWNKDSRSSKTIYRDSLGNEINVNDGNTFIQIQPTNKNVILE